MDQEKCEICWELAPTSDFVTVPCDFGHRFMASCIVRWFVQQKNQPCPSCHCPKCRQGLRYKACEHWLEPQRLRASTSAISRAILVQDLAATVCLSCRDQEIASRRLHYRLTAWREGGPSWHLLEPGDLIPQMILDYFTPERLKDEYRQLRDEHAKRVLQWREVAQKLLADGLKKGYLQLMSDIVEYERVRKASADMNTLAVFGDYDEIETDEDGEMNEDGHEDGEEEDDEDGAEEGDEDGDEDKDEDEDEDDGIV